MSYKAICLTRLTGQPLILSNHFTCRQQTVVDWVETFTKRLAEAFSNFELPGRGEQPEPVAWVDDETLGLFKPIHGALPGEEFYLLCFLSSFQTPVALEAFEKVHGYVQGIMRIPSENIKVQFRHIEIESALQDIFSKLIYLSRKLDLDQTNPSPSALEASITRMYPFRSLANPTCLQLLNRPALIHCHSANTDKGRRSKYAWVKPTPAAPRNAEEIEAIHDISRTLAAEVKIGSKKVISIVI